MPVPRVRNLHSAFDQGGVWVRNVERQANCFDCEFGETGQNLASIGLLEAFWSAPFSHCYACGPIAVNIVTSDFYVDIRLTRAYKIETRVPAINTETTPPCTRRFVPAE